MGIRIIKTALSVVLAITLAQSLGLQSPYSTGLLAIMGVDVTKRKGLRTSVQRIAASLVGLLIAAYLFWLLGFHVWVIGLYILILFPILARAQLKEGAVTGSVVMFHIFAGGQINTGVIINEISLLLVGLGTATLINIVYMPKEDKQLLDLRERLESCFSRIFKEISNHLRDTRYVWSGKELLEASDILEKAKIAVHRSKENALFQGDTSWAVYFYMRSQQMESVDRMVQYVAQVYQTLPHGEQLASVFDEMSSDVKVPHYTGQSEKKLAMLEEQFKEMALPSSREEFEIRSALLQLMVELKTYLAVAKREKKQKEPAAADSE